MGAKGAPIDWLLDTGDAWVQYRARLDLLGQPEDAPEVQAARAAMLADPRVVANIALLANWPEPPLKNHKTAGHPLHRLSFLAEIGLRADDPGMGALVERILAQQAPEGAFQIMMHMWRAESEADKRRITWMLCDAPLVLWALLRLGLADDDRVRRAVDHLAGQIRDNGWPCGSGSSDTFRGPGRKDDPCPYANLLGVKALASVPFDFAERDRVQAAGIESLLWHWAIQKERKVYLFGIGTDFRKPRLPLVWYDILHVVDVLSQFPAARADARYRAVLGELMAQADDAGRFTPASMYRDWSEWEFANKKAPSPAITLIAWRAALRQTGPLAAD